jgi:glycosyltransferase involved in cell wall biosynthesis
MQSLAELTIVVPTRNEAANIEAFLASIPAECELIVVDKSTDGTADIVRRRRPERTAVLECADSLTVARQRGALAARTPWLLFTDADVTFAPNYFAALAAALGERCPRALGLLFGPKLSADDYEGHYRRLAVAQRVLGSLGFPAASGSNMLVTAEAFAAVGGFDTALNCNEDSELGWRIARAGFGWRCDSRLVTFARDHRRLRCGAQDAAHRVPLHGAVFRLDPAPLAWSRLGLLAQAARGCRLISVRALVTQLTKRRPSICAKTTTMGIER